MKTSGLELKIPPVALVGLVGAAMWGLGLMLPEMRIPAPGRGYLSAAFALVGATFAIEGVRAFRAARTTVDPTRPEAASTLVAVGIYRYTRNPMYVGFLLALVAWACLLPNLLTAFGCVFFVGYMNRFQIDPEERALESRFGEDFTRYRQQVRRWL